jgi:hypothetical protein
MSSDILAGNGNIPDRLRNSQRLLPDSRHATVKSSELQLQLQGGLLVLTAAPLIAAGSGTDCEG